MTPKALKSLEKIASGVFLFWVVIEVNKLFVQNIKSKNLPLAKYVKE